MLLLIGCVQTYQHLPTTPPVWVHCSKLVVYPPVGNYTNMKLIYCMLDDNCHTVYRDHEGLGFLAEKFHQQTSQIFTLSQHGIIS